jgi:hypothetical protein
MNNSLRSDLEEILQELMLDVLAEASREAGKDIFIGTFPEIKRADQILNLVASKMPENTKVPHSGDFNAEGWANYGRALGRNEALAEVKSILKEGI